MTFSSGGPAIATVDLTTIVGFGADGPFAAGGFALATAAVQNYGSLTVNGRRSRSSPTARL